MYPRYYYYTSIKNFKENWKDFSPREISDMCRRQKLSRKTLREMKDHLDWNVISENQPLTEELIVEFKDEINWANLIKYNGKVKLSEQFIEEMIDYIDWDALSRSRWLSLDFVKRHANDLNANLLFSNYKNKNLHTASVLDMLLKSGARKYYNWTHSLYEGVTLDFVREYKDVIHFSRIFNAFSNEHKLEQLVDEFHKYFKKEDWDHLSRMLYNMSYNFIIKYSDYWSYSNYSNPVKYNNKLTMEERRCIHYLWEKRISETNKY